MRHVLALAVDYDVDLYNAAALSLVVPDGVTWAIGSGLLLSAIPEAHSMLLLAVGLTLTS